MALRHDRRYRLRIIPCSGRKRLGNAAHRRYQFGVRPGFVVDYQRGTIRVLLGDGQYGGTGSIGIRGLHSMQLIRFLADSAQYRDKSSPD